MLFDNVPQLKTNAAKEAEDGSDGEWQTTWKDFLDEAQSSNSSSSCGSFQEMPLSQLGIYDAEEDTRVWDFVKTWADDQWQEEDLTLKGDQVFTGSQPGPTTFRATPGQPIDYFRDF